MTRGEEKKIIEEAKVRFPVGTKCSNVNIGRGCEFTIQTSNFRFNEGRLIIDGMSDTHGVGCTTYTVWMKGHWCDNLYHKQDLEDIRKFIQE